MSRSIVCGDAFAAFSDQRRLRPGMASEAHPRHRPAESQEARWTSFRVPCSSNSRRSSVSRSSSRTASAPGIPSPWQRSRALIPTATRSWSTPRRTRSSRSRMPICRSILCAILLPVIPIGNVPLVLMVSASKGYKSVADLVAAAKAKHGNMNYVSGGAGSSTHFSAEAFRLAAGFQAVHIPQKGAPEALTEVLADRADFYFSPLSPALPFLDGGQATGPGSQRLAADQAAAADAYHSRSGLSAGRIQFLDRPVRAARRSLPRSSANCGRRLQRFLIIRQCRRGWRDWASILCRSILPAFNKLMENEVASTPASPTPSA